MAFFTILAVAAIVAVLGLCFFSASMLLGDAFRFGVLPM
jgi:hypothetical protein